MPLPHLLWLLYGAGHGGVQILLAAGCMPGALPQRSTAAWASPGSSRLTQDPPWFSVEFGFIGRHLSAFSCFLKFGHDKK